MPKLRCITALLALSLAVAGGAQAAGVQESSVQAPSGPSRPAARMPVHVEGIMTAGAASMPTLRDRLVARIAATPRLAGATKDSSVVDVSLVLLAHPDVPELIAYTLIFTRASARGEEPYHLNSSTMMSVANEERVVEDVIEALLRQADRWIEMGAPGPEAVRRL